MSRALMAVLLMLICTAVVYAQTETWETSTDKNSRITYVVTGMGGLSQEIANSSENYDLLHVGVGIQYGFADRWALRVEALPFINAVGTEEFIDDVRGYGGLGSLLYYFSEDNVSFYGEFNAGGAYFSEEIPVIGATKFNFLLGLGAGVEIPASESARFILGYRYYHVSNSATGDRNPGINAHSILVGMRFGL